LKVIIYKAQTKSLVEQELFSQLLQRLPPTLHAKALRYRSKVSAYNYIVGRLLLKHGLETIGYDNDLEKISFQKNDKPSLPAVQFNISHSDHQVICGFASKGQIGVDLEKIKPIDLEDFTSTFSAKEWAAIKTSDDPLRSFYWFWTRKESIIKAMGLNLNYLHRIELDVSKDHFVIEGVSWFLRDVDLGVEFASAVCSQEQIDEIEIVEVKF